MNELESLKTKIQDLEKEVARLETELRKFKQSNQIMYTKE